ncbi:MAG: DUF3575 domain-containing protein [Chitinophagaceae bacterium]
MKKTLILAAMLPIAVLAQQSNEQQKATDTIVAKKPISNKYEGSKNILKINLSSLALNNYHVTFEKLIYNKVSFAVSYRYMPYGNFPFASAINDIFNNKDININNAKIGGYAITPEFRFYAKKGMKGIYMSPYFRYSHFDLSIPINFATGIGAPTKTATFNGSLNAVSGGLLIGLQRQIFKKVNLDIWIIGGHFGHSSGDLVANYTTLTEPERAALESELDGIDVAPFVFRTGKVSTTKADIVSDGPWAGLRGAGISIGFRF